MHQKGQRVVIVDDLLATGDGRGYRETCAGR